MFYSFNFNYSSRSDNVKLAFNIMLNAIQDNIDDINKTVNTIGILNFINGFNILKVEGDVADMELDNNTLYLMSENLKIKKRLLEFLRDIRNLCAHIYEKEKNKEIFKTENLYNSKYFYNKFNNLLSKRRMW